MFREALIQKDIPKKEFEENEAKLREKLLIAQEKLKKLNSQLIINISGTDRFGNQKVLSRLHQWFDPRYLKTRVFQFKINEKDLKGPFFERFWKAMPPKGHIGVYLRAWYTNVLLEHVYGKDDEKLDHRIRTINQYEKILYDDGAFNLKIWFHKPRDILKKELKKAEKEPEEYWWVSKRDSELLKNYDKAMKTAETLVSKSNNLEAPWVIIDSSKERYRDLTLGRKILESLENIIEREERNSQSPPSAIIRPGASENLLGQKENVLDQVDLNNKYSKAVYKKQLAQALAEHNALSRKVHQKKMSQIFVFEGWDSAGKGGAIRRLVLGMDPSIYRIHPIAAPTEIELKHHYLWRFWTRMPSRGYVSIFDRSWYGRVLVERVEGLAKSNEWQRAYNEINMFEDQQIEDRTIIHKYWIHISKEEQFRRFQERERTPYKNFKITEEDYRNREKWDEYSEAVHDMVLNTSTPMSPWNIIAGEDKRFARVEVIKKANKQIKKVLD